MCITISIYRFESFVIHPCNFYSFRYNLPLFLNFPAPVMTNDAATAYICIYCPFNSDNLEALENHLTSIN